MYTKLWSENFKEEDHLEDPGIDGRIILELNLGKSGRKLWARCMWLRIGIHGGLL